MINEKRTISVIITAFNQEECIWDCVQSVRRQTYQNLQIIIVDDGSTDRTPEICKKLAEEDLRIEYLVQTNAGVSAARNLGVARAKGDFIAFTDGDDKLKNTCLEELYRNMDSVTDIVCCCCHTFGDTDGYDDHFFDRSYDMATFAEKEKLFLQLLNGNSGKPKGCRATAIGVPWGKLYRADFLRDNHLGFEPTLKRRQDNIFNMWAFYCARKIKYLDEPLYFYRIDHVKNSRSTNDGELWLALLWERDKFFGLHPEILTPNIVTQRRYEMCVALAVSADSACAGHDRRQIRHVLEELRSNKFYDMLLGETADREWPAKLRLMHFLFRNRLYGSIYYLFWVYDRCMASKMQKKRF